MWFWLQCSLCCCVALLVLGWLRYCGTIQSGCVHAFKFVYMWLGCPCATVGAMTMPLACHSPGSPQSNCVLLGFQ